MHTSICTPIHPPIHPSIHPSIHPPSIYISTHLSILTSIHHYIHLPGLRSSLHASIFPCIHPPILPSVHPFIHPSIHFISFPIIPSTNQPNNNTQTINQSLSSFNESTANKMLSIIYLSSLGTQPVGLQCFFLRLFPCLGVFRSSFLFLRHWISFVFFLYDRSICTTSLDLLFLTLGEFQAWDWHGSLGYQLTCGPRGEVAVRMEQKSRSKLLSWPGFEHRASHLAVQHATARPPQSPQML